MKVRARQWTTLRVFGPLLAAGLAAGLWGAAQPAATVAPPARLETPRTLTLHGLIDSRGRVFARHRLEGRATLVFSGFTSCPDICPATLAKLTQAVRVATATLGDAAPQIIFVTVDPHRDTSKRLANYLAAFDPAPLGVTGAPDNLRRMLDSLGFISGGSALTVGAPPSLHAGHGGSERLPHSTAIALVGPDAHVQALLRAPHDPHRLSQSIIALLR